MTEEQHFTLMWDDKIIKAITEIADRDALRHRTEKFAMERASRDRKLWAKFQKANLILNTISTIALVTIAITLFRGL